MDALVHVQDTAEAEDVPSIRADAGTVRSTYELLCHLRAHCASARQAALRINRPKMADWCSDAIQRIDQVLPPLYAAMTGHLGIPLNVADAIRIELARLNHLVEQLVGPAPTRYDPSDDPDYGAELPVTYAPIPDNGDWREIARL